MAHRQYTPAGDYHPVLAVFSPQGLILAHPWSHWPTVSEPGGGWNEDLFVEAGEGGWSVQGFVRLESKWKRGAIKRRQRMIGQFALRQEMLRQYKNSKTAIWQTSIWQHMGEKLIMNKNYKIKKWKGMGRSNGLFSSLSQLEVQRQQLLLLDILNLQQINQFRHCLTDILTYLQTWV